MPLQFVQRRLLTFSFKRLHSQEPLGQFQPNLVGNILGMGIRICSNKGAGLFWGPI